MKYFAVYGMTKHQAYDDYQRPIPGRNILSWYIIGVFRAATAEKACQAAAKKNGSVGSFFAVEGYPWGIDLLEVDAEEFGGSEEESLEARVKKGLSNLEQLEVRTREMEREAGIGDS